MAVSYKLLKICQTPVQELDVFEGRAEVWDGKFLNLFWDELHGCLTCPDHLLLYIDLYLQGSKLVLEYSDSVDGSQTYILEDLNLQWYSKRK